MDLVYAELTVCEPAIDARRILGEDGLAGGCSPYVTLALRELGLASDWNQARARLREIHRLVHDEAGVIPLWQLSEHFAHHESVQGATGPAAYLYENVHQWQANFTYPSQQP